MKPLPPPIVFEPLLPGETIARRATIQQYHALVRAEWRGRTRAAIPQLQRLLRPASGASVAVQDAQLHLLDAANEALPPRVRAQHFLLAGVAVAAAIDWIGATPALQAFLEEWQRAVSVRCLDSLVDREPEMEVRPS